ncbi:isopentenyl phosphate kinase-like [Panicum hallii]|uniref:isopentenyl phosphate kinase-like n=1 Tax=Panicum hallii TaxID=206008 RepID=UPI000DF4D3B4|nr:isopentenyl phosphate kinase-like [Panicum hallii]
MAQFVLVEEQHCAHWIAWLGSTLYALGYSFLRDIFKQLVLISYLGVWSFGHFPASRSGVHKGGLHWTLVKASFVATRISVTSLNQEIVRALAREGIPYVGMSPFACGWSTSQRKVNKLENYCFPTTDIFLDFF